MSSNFKSKPAQKFIIPPSDQARYTCAWVNRDLRFFWAANALQTLRFTQLLIEMLLRRKVNAKKRWFTIAAIECIKCYLRLLLLSITRRPVIYPHIPQLGDQLADSQRNASSDPPISGDPPRHLANNRIPPDNASRASAHDEKSVEHVLVAKALAGSSLLDPANLVTPFMNMQSLCSELLYILRPLIYVSCLLRPRKDRRISPLAWAFSFEILSRWLRRRVSASSTLERDEYARRDQELVWYLFREDLWLQLTRPKLGQLASAIGQIPVIGILRYVVEDWMPLIDEYYYCKPLFLPFLTSSLLNLHKDTSA